ncbi:MAG: heparin lyase I family protein [Pseudomonadota bacterium]
MISTTLTRAAMRRVQTCFAIAKGTLGLLGLLLASTVGAAAQDKAMTLDGDALLMTTMGSTFVKGADDVKDKPGDTDLDGDLIENSLRFNFDAKGDPSTIRVWRDASVSFNGNHSIAYQLRDPGAPGRVCPGATNKAMHQLYTWKDRHPIYPRLVAQDPNRFQCGAGRALKCNDEYQPVGERRFVSFSVFVPGPELYVAPPQKAKRSLIYQLWQGSPYSPALAGMLEDGDDEVVNLRFYIRNDRTTGRSACQNGRWSDPSLQIHTGPIPLRRNVWHRFTIMTEPRHIGSDRDGLVKVWKVSNRTMKTELVVDWRGRYGFDRTVANLRGRKPNHRFQAMLGLYRERQKTQQRIFFDAIYVGKTFQSVRPDIASAL